MTGTVKFFNESKGFGFITNDESGDDVFVHVTALDGLTLHEGDKVEYVEEEGKKGKQASQIKLFINICRLLKRPLWRFLFFQ